ncbi:hypothetical protein [Arthrobacter sp. USHLN218]|uniref:hypothetical protein n=1 Tax=Arthrobacter sp. USHLN218 TaxID=3081232 RepID=UPI00301B32DB
MSSNRPTRRDDPGIPRIDWRGTLWAMLFVFLLSYVFIALFPGMHAILRIVLVLALYFAGRYVYHRYLKKRR